MSDTRKLHITMPDNTVWSVPVMEIARNRAAHYADEFGGDVERSLAEDTLLLFAEDDYEIKDWAANNMNWSDVAHAAVKVADAPALTARDFQEAWVNGDKEVVV